MEEMPRVSHHQTTYNVYNTIKTLKKRSGETGEAQGKTADGKQAMTQ